MGMTAGEALGRSLGQQGSGFEDGTTAVDPTRSIIAIQVVTDAVFTALSPEGTAKWVGTTNQRGDALDGSNTFPAGLVLYGRWDSFTLASGSVVYYLG